MNARWLVDTNVLVYPYDPSDPAKQRLASRIVEALVESGAGCVSTQVLSEFYSVLTRKLRHVVTPLRALESLQHLAKLWEVLPVTSEVILTAARGAYDHQMSFWDAQLWAVARLYDVPGILTEDLQDGAMMEGVRIVNPFRPGRRIEDLLT